MKLTNLKENPQFFKETLNLIEESFGYEEHNSFEIDFYPLINEENHHNCHLLIDNNEVVAHIGALTKNLSINNKDFLITMFGGIAVHEKYRGQGKFSELFKSILPLYKESMFYLLWSDKIEMYQKFGFHPCIQLNQYDENKNESFPQNIEVEQNFLIDIPDEEFTQIKDLYTSKSELRIQRTDKDWERLKQITSASTYLIYQDDKLINYFIKDKGQDLGGVIHEYGFMNSGQLQIMQNFGTVWTPESFEGATTLFASLLAIGNSEIFKKFVLDYIGIEITNITEQIEFKFEDNLITLPVDEFLQGIFGPGRFAELNGPFVAISGLDSI